MNITTLNLKNFRNYENQQFTFSEGINILTGENAQGKTNCAEAIFLLCTGYSPRANKDKLLVKSDKESAEIEGKADTLYGNVGVKMVINKADKKSIYINGIQVLKVGELLGNIHSVFFNPMELKLVQESPEDRRRFLNISLSQMSKSYFYALNAYNRIISQRNNLLKDQDKDIIRDTLPVWDLQLTKHASKIIKARNEFLEQLSPIAEEKQAFLTDGKETLKMRTESGYQGSEEDIEKQLYADLKDSIEKDIRLGFTTIGPHRDDIKFMLNQTDVRLYGSQGQQRTVALALKLAEADLFFKRFNEFPILILDDVLSELDKKRQRKLIESVKDIQTIFTATHFDRTVFKTAEVKRFTIENGGIKKCY